MTENVITNDDDTKAPPTSGEPNASMLANPDEEFLQRLRDATAALENIAKKRADLSAEKTALLESLASNYAVNKKAMLAAIQYADLKDTHKENWDMTYQVTRRALGEPIQNDLFEAQLQKGVENAVAAKQKH